MKKSNLQFKNPRLTDICFKINPDFIDSKDKSADMKLDFNINIKKDECVSEAIVELNIQIGTQDSTSPFYINATEEAVFRWNSDTAGKENVLLEQNAPAILLGYLRPIISMLTAFSPFTAYNIPLINFMK